MKYNKSEIMKNAWFIRKSEGITMSEALTKAWARAKKEDNMDEIKALIDKYQIFMAGVDKIGAHGDADTLRREVLPRKAEIIAYMDAKDNERREIARRREATFASIPGVREVSDARRRYAKWYSAFSRCIEEGNGRNPRVDKPTSAEIESLEQKYPMAVFALECSNRAHSSGGDYRTISVYHKSYCALCDGEDPAKVKAEHDVQMDKIMLDNIWR